MMLDHGLLEAVRKRPTRCCPGDWGRLRGNQVAERRDVGSGEAGKLINFLFSVCDIDGGIFIITEIDRSVTTILFPEEY